MGCAFVGGGKKSTRKLGYLEAVLKGRRRERGKKKKNQKWIQCKLRVEGDASSKDDRKTILWPC